ncbi:MAG: magnesium/cobalt transporter CorA [Anaerolineales bacterium]|nr:magnesium/cobalt transporter CorA [Anaerolineales bacterium]
MIRSIFCPKNAPRQLNLSQDQMAQALQDPEGLLWVSLEETNEAEVNAILGDVFHFHPLTIEDCLSDGYQAPKVDIFNDYLFIIVHALLADFPLDQLDTMELNFFLGPNYLVTSYTCRQMSPIKAVWNRLERDARLLENGADFLCYTILDQLMDEYLPLLDSMDEEIDHLEDQVVLAKPERGLLQRILALKHSILTLRRIIAPQREVMNRLSRDDLPQIQDAHRIYYRDIYDHLVRIHDLSESIRDVATGTLDTYLSAASNRLNEVMKALTIVSTIFLPLSFVAGVYGMNFEFFPEIRWEYGYLYVWGVFMAIVAGMLWFFRRRGWI